MQVLVFDMDDDRSLDLLLTENLRHAECGEHTISDLQQESRLDSARQTEG